MKYTCTTTSKSVEREIPRMKIFAKDQTFAKARKKPPKAKRQRIKTEGSEPHIGSNPIPRCRSSRSLLVSRTNGKKNMSRAIVQAKEGCTDNNGTSILLSKRQSLAPFPRIQMTNTVSNLKFFYTDETNEELASTANGTAIHLKS
jgi:hypothetical protein